MIAFITFECGGGGGEKAHQFHLVTHPLLRPESIAAKEEEECIIIRLIFLQSTTDCAGALKEGENANARGSRPPPSCSWTAVSA